MGQTAPEWRLPRHFNAGGSGVVVILLDDFRGGGEKSYFWASASGLMRRILGLRLRFGRILNGTNASRVLRFAADNPQGSYLPETTVYLSPVHPCRVEVLRDLAELEGACRGKSSTSRASLKPIPTS